MKKAGPACLHVVTGFFSANLVIADAPALGYNLFKIIVTIINTDTEKFNWKPKQSQDTLII